MDILPDSYHNTPRNNVWNIMTDIYPYLDQTGENSNLYFILWNKYTLIFGIFNLSPFARTTVTFKEHARKLHLNTHSSLGRYFFSVNETSVKSISGNVFVGFCLYLEFINRNKATLFILTISQNFPILQKYWQMLTLTLLKTRVGIKNCLALYFIGI